MSSERFIGAYQRILPSQPEDVVVVVDDSQAASDWQEADRLARFFAEYLGFCGGHQASAEQLASVGYATNELAENAIKYSANHCFELVGWAQNDGIVLGLRNTMDADRAERLVESAESISQDDPHMLFIQRVEDNADGLETGSGLGLLTLIVDHGAQLGWRLDPAGDARVQLHTLVRLPATHEE